MLALRDEGRGCVVDEDVERCLAPDRIHQVVDGGTIANIARDCRDLAAGLRAHLSRGCFEPVELAAADDELGAEREEAAPHRGTEARAAAGDEDALIPEQTCFKHRLNPPFSYSIIAGHRVREATRTISAGRILDCFAALAT